MTKIRYLFPLMLLLATMLCACTPALSDTVVTTDNRDAVSNRVLNDTSLSDAQKRAFHSAFDRHEDIDRFSFRIANHAKTRISGFEADAKITTRGGGPIFSGPILAQINLDPGTSTVFAFDHKPLTTISL